MATGTGPLESQDIFNKVWNPPGTAPVASPDSLSVYLAGGSAMVGSGSFPAIGQPALNVVPAFRQFILNSVTSGSASATGTTTTGLGGFSMVEIYIRMTGMTGTISTLDLFADSRLDGTNYVNLVHVTQLTSATGATADLAIRLQKQPGTNSLFEGLRVDAGAGTIRDIGWGDDLRIRRDVSGGTTSPIFSYTVTVNAKA